MKLFYSPGSSSLLPHIVLLEAGLPFTAIQIDEHTKAIEGGGDFRTVNPLGYVPALGGAAWTVRKCHFRTSASSALPDQSGRHEPGA